MPQSSQDIRKAIEAKWNEYLSKYGNLFSSENISGSSPPSVFVGSYNYPKVNVGPMIPPIHGDTVMLDSPEQWAGKSLDEIINYRLNLIRGIQKTSVIEPSGRYIENIQELTMANKPTDSELTFYKSTQPVSLLDGSSAPFGPVGQIKNAKFSNSSSNKQIEKAYYDRDLLSKDAVLKLYNSGIEVSKIQKCFSIGMFGKKRKLVPTKWSITATDDIISKFLIDESLNFSVIDSYKVFSFNHLGNIFSVLLFPHTWLFEMIEAWYSHGILGFGSDHEDARGIDHPPNIAGAYFAAKLAVGEYLVKHQIQCGTLILREIRPEYSVPVGVWQIREGIRSAMKQKPQILTSFESALDTACSKLSISKQEWLDNGNIMKLLKQRILTDYF